MWRVLPLLDADGDEQQQLAGICDALVSAGAFLDVRILLEADGELEVDGEHPRIEAHSGRFRRALLPFSTPVIGAAGKRLGLLTVVETPSSPALREQRLRERELLGDLAAHLGRRIEANRAHRRQRQEAEQMRASLSQADRLASVGMLAAGVAHEINNPLTYVLYNIEGLARKAPRLARDLRLSGRGSNAELEGLLGEILECAREACEGAHRVRDIVRDLKTFSRVQQDEVGPVSLNEVVNGAINMAFHEIKYRARLVKDLGDVPPVLANTGRVAQVFLNLLLNAAHATEEGNVAGNEIRIRTWVEGGRVMGSVSDTGVGVDPVLSERIFEPFFSTKEAGEGSGMGLSISRNIIASYGGTLELAARPGRGTRFVISLPLTTTQEIERRTGNHAAIAAENEPGGRLLVVDDEARICGALRRLLGNHEVVVAHTGTEAQRILEQDDDFDVILSDLMMPGKTGMDVHTWLAGHCPALAGRMVFMTGGAFTPKARFFLDNVSNVRLEKPIDPQNLIALVAQMVKTSTVERSTSAADRQAADEQPTAREPAA